MGFDRIFGERQALADELVGQALGEQVEDFQLARGYADFPGAVLAIQRAILVADHYLRAIQQLSDCLQQGFAVGRFADEAGGAELQRGV